LNKEIKRRADVVGIFPNESAIIRLIGAALLEAHGEWQLHRKFHHVDGHDHLRKWARASHVACSIRQPGIEH